MNAAPFDRGFEYTVRLAVAIPLSWAKILKTVGANHYDYKCRENADHGVVNALHNVALRNVEDSTSRSSYPVAQNDCDGMMKVLEQARYHDFDPMVVRQIRAWLYEVVEKISVRHAEVSR